MNYSNEQISEPTESPLLPILSPSERSEDQNLEGINTITYDVGDNIEYRIPTTSYSQESILSEASISSPFEGLAASASDDSEIFLSNQETSICRPGTVFEDDDRYRITPTTSYPWRTIVKLFITWGSYSTFGTGSIIDENHVLTAGHCVYSHTLGGWADSIKVVPGADNGNEPFGHAWAIDMRTYADWIDNQMHEHDFAVITLDSNIGLQTGWMGLMTAIPSSSIYTQGLNTAGYPYDLDGGLNMYWDYDNGAYANDFNHWYYMDSSGGQSGSPVWVYDGTMHYILTVQAYSDNGSGANYGTRITQNKKECIYNWITADSTSIDKPDIRDRRDTFSGYSPTIVGSGLTNFNAWCDIQNIGTIPTGAFTVSYYASTDTTFSEADYLIGVDTLPSISPTSWVDSSCLSIFPRGVPTGRYYIGWIMDINDNIDEFREYNNVGFIWTDKVLVDATAPSNPISCVQTNSSTESDVWQEEVNDPSFTWSGASDAHTGIDGYYYYWGNNSSGKSSSYTTSLDYDPPQVNNGTYFLRIQAKDLVGNNASWTTLYVFKYNGDLNKSNDTLPEPLDDSYNSESVLNPEEDSKNNDGFRNYDIALMVCIISIVLLIQITLLFKGLIKVFKKE